MSGDLWLFGATAFATVFSIVDPFAAAPIFIAITPTNSDDERRRMARLASFVCCGVLLVFALTGNRIFAFFGISPPAFRVAGGILLLMVALDMLRARESATKQTPEEQKEGTEKTDVSVTPLGIPLLAGPGAISTVALLGTQADWMRMAILGAAIVITSLLSWILLANAVRLVRVLGQIGVKIVTRIMGLLLAGIGAQFILTGIRQFWALPPP